MKKIATLAIAALLAGASTYAIAQAPTPAPDAPAAGQQQERQEGRRGLSQDDYNRLVDARIAAIKAGLKLTPDQEGLWAPVENAIRTAANERFARFEQRRGNREQRQSMDLMQRLERRSTLMTEHAQRSSALTTALRPLWNTFSEDQKRIAPRLLHSVVNKGGMGWHERGGRRGHDGHRGPRGHHGRMMEHHRGMGMGPGGGEQPSAPTPAPAPQQQ